MYQDIKPLHPTNHGDLKLRPLANVNFAKTAHAVPVVGPEFSDVARDFVIAFVPLGEGKGYGAMAALGLRTNENLFINAEGQWDARYMPIFLRRYPFLTSELDTGEAIICIDETAARELHGEDGMPLFENGEPTESTKTMANTLFRVREDARRDQVWIKELADADLFRSVSASAELPSGEKVAMDGMWVVDEEKLRAIPDAKAAEWVKNGVMSLIYAHLLSLRNLGDLANRLQKQAAAQ
jgi:hypothetical protein